MNEEESAQQTSSSKTLVKKGIGGWLLFLCLSLTVFNPLVNLAALAKGYAVSSKYFDLYNGLLIIFIIDVILAAVIMTYSFYSGLKLWRVRPGAVRTAKLCLLCIFANGVIGALLPFMAGLPSQYNEAIIDPAIIQIFGSIIYLVIWYSYLSMSHRVRNTFLSNALTPSEQQIKNLSAPNRRRLTNKAFFTPTASRLVNSLLRPGSPLCSG